MTIETGVVVQVIVAIGLAVGGYFWKHAIDGRFDQFKLDVHELKGDVKEMRSEFGKVHERITGAEKELAGTQGELRRHLEESRGDWPKFKGPKA